MRGKCFVDFTLSPAAEEFRLRFRGWLEEHMPVEWRSYAMHAQSFDDAVRRRQEWGRLLHSGGWAGPAWPVANGGLGLGIDELAAYNEELVRCGAPEPMNANAIGILAPTIMRFGTADQQVRHLPPMLAHQVSWCQGFSEPGAGSDLAGLTARAVHDAGSGTYRLSGQKLWTSRAQYADWCYILVRTDPESRRHEGISMMLLRMDQPGVETRPLRSIAGSDEFNELFLDDAVVEERDVLGSPGDGWRLAMFALGNERGTRLVERALRFRKEHASGVRDVRTALAIGDVPGQVPESLAQASIDARVVDAMAHRILALSAEGADLGALPSMAKLVWSEGYQRFLTVMVHSFGVHGLPSTPPYDAWQDRLLRGRAATIYGGTSEVQRNVIAKSLGLPASATR
jgi:alkylation response protein AidB-like acyl-CoA dehydrogenase